MACVWRARRAGNWHVGRATGGLHAADRRPEAVPGAGHRSHGMVCWLVRPTHTDSTRLYARPTRPPLDAGNVSACRRTLKNHARRDLSECRRGNAHRVPYPLENDSRSTQAARRQGSTCGHCSSDWVSVSERLLCGFQAAHWRVSTALCTDEDSS